MCLKLSIGVLGTEQWGTLVCMFCVRKGVRALYSNQRDIDFECGGVAILGLQFFLFFSLLLVCQSIWATRDEAADGDFPDTSTAELFPTIENHPNAAVQNGLRHICPSNNSKYAGIASMGRAKNVTIVSTNMIEWNLKGYAKPYRLNRSIALNSRWKVYLKPPSFHYYKFKLRNLLTKLLASQN